MYFLKYEKKLDLHPYGCRVQKCCTKFCRSLFICLFILALRGCSDSKTASLLSLSFHKFWFLHVGYDWSLLVAVTSNNIPATTHTVDSDYFIHMMTGYSEIKDEAQTALFKDPVRTAQ